MALVLKDRVKETTTTTGTGALTLLGASTGYQSFAAIGNGNTCYYAISSTGGSEWEVGIGTYTASGTTLSRDTILESSSGGGAISLSAGTKDVYVVYPAEKGVWLDASGNVVQSQFTSMNVTGTATINVATLTSGTVATTPSVATSIANKQYVDDVAAAGIHYHAPVRVESPIALTATYNNGTAGVGATLTNSGTQVALVIDGVTVSVNDRVLIYTQTNQTQNGIYTVTNVGSGSTNWVLTRATDADTFESASPDGLSQGSTVFVQQGTTGAGETYTCNTPGTITFGTTNITFAQISSGQIYSAGAGLTLSGTQFSVTNTGVTAQTYGNAGQVPQIAVNARGQITSASNVAIAITASNVSGLAASATTDTTNASNITSGTLANARTTASASNGASTIVARDASGNFSAAGITATTFSGSGASLTSLNATAITTGTLDNARTSASASNGASTIVARDASGNFAAATITATTFSGAHSGNGSALTNLNASAVTTGTLDNARTSASSTNGASTIVARDASGNFAANTITATLTGTASNATVLQTARNFEISNGATAAAVSFNGSAAVNLNVTALNASILSAGTVPAARMSGSYTGITGVGTLTAGTWNATAITDTYLATISTAGKVANSATTATASNGASTIVARDANGSFTANVGTFTTVTGTHSGDGSGLTNLNATALSSGTVATGRISGSYTGITGVGTLTAGTWNATAITDTYLATISTAGKVSNSATTASSANGASTIVARDASGNFTANTGTFTTITGAGSGVTSLNASNLASGTVPDARFPATLPAVSGVNLTNLNASNIASGTIANARTTATSANGASTIVARDANGSFSANVGTFITLSGAGGAITALNASNINAGTIPNANTTASSSNGASTIVARDASGNFTANTITATTFSGSGASLTSLNASNLSSGTVATARLASGTANSSTYLRGDQTWATVASSNKTSFGLFENAIIISANYTIDSGNNAISAGPVTVNSGVTVTVPAGSTWTIT
jgi:trimeric autotransporter adhesin